jgi:glycosyltransferase involved in cell wall biosynthesis
MPSPLVSVVVPAFNAEARIGSSLASAVAQTYDRIEVIVVDDGSIDDTAVAAQRVLQSY